MNRKIKYWILSVVLFVLGFSFLILVFENKKNAITEEKKIAGNSYSSMFGKYALQLSQPDWEEILHAGYDSLLLTSYRCHNFDEESLGWAFGVNPLQIIWRTGSAYEVETYLKDFLQYVDTVKVVFLELDPRKHYDEDLLEQIRMHNEIQFFIFYGPLSIDEWKSLEQKEVLEKRWDQYVKLSNSLVEFENVNLFCFDKEEWMISNPNLYKDSRTLHEDAIFQIYGSFGSGKYKVTKEMLQDEWKETLHVPKKIECVDLQGQVVACLGDSMLAKSRGGFGPAEIASGFLNAEVYNLAISGSSVTGEKPEDLTQMAEYLINLENCQNPDYIILSYGYNDYSLEVLPGISEDNNELSFEEVYRDNIKKLKKTYPQTNIILSTPPKSSVDLGTKYSLDMYVDIIEKIAEEEKLYCLNNYDAEEMSDERLDEILIDGVHFNEKGCYIQGNRIAALIQDIHEKK